MVKFKKHHSKNNAKRNRKIFGWLLFSLSVFIMFSFMLRFSFIMLTGTIDGVDLNQLGTSLHSIGQVIEARRGTIFDRNEQTIATDALSYKMIAVLTDAWSPIEKPIHIQDPEAVADVLDEYLTMKKSDILDKLTSSAAQVEFGADGSNLSYDQKIKIEESLEAEGLTGIEFQESQSRLYPNGVFASHMVGLAQSDSDEDASNHHLEGVMGLEYYFDDLLSGEDGAQHYQKDGDGYALPNEKEQREEAIDGMNLHLTLDRRLQVLLENVLDDQDKLYHPANMTATVMDAKTGEILATSQRPTFNPMTKEGLDDTWQTFLTEYEYEPGSTMKVFTLAAAIEEGVFNPNEFYQSGQYRVGDGVVNDWNRDWGAISYLEGLHRSSNAAFIKLVEKMGYDTWKSYLDQFGFGQLTGISLPNEQMGSNPFNWELQKANTAFGQGITVTLIQMLQAMTAITNDGEMVQPTIVSGISDQAGNHREVEVTTKGKPISAETAHQVLEYLAQGVESEQGTAIGYHTEGIRIATKTGTAQFINPETGAYYMTAPNFIYSSLSAFPSDDPKYVVYITVQQPQLIDKTGGMIVQDIFHRLKDRLLMKEQSLDEEISTQQSVEQTDMPNVVGVSVQEAQELLGQRRVTVIGNGEAVTAQSPLANATTYDGERVFLLTEGPLTLPDLTGWSRNDLLRLAEFMDINFKFEGEGFVNAQSIEPGQVIEPGTTVDITLSQPNRIDTEASPDELWDESTFMQEDVSVQ